MQSFITLFCDDIREEKSGVDTIVGVYPDNLNVGEIPSMIPKVGIYTRIYFGITDEIPKIVTIDLNIPWSNEIIKLASFDRAGLQDAFDQAKNSGLKRVGIIMKAMLVGFRILEPGIIDAILNIDGAKVISGSIRIVSSAG